MGLMLVISVAIRNPLGGSFNVIDHRVLYPIGSSDRGKHGLRTKIAIHTENCS